MHRKKLSFDLFLYTQAHKHTHSYTLVPENDDDNDDGDVEEEAKEDHDQPIRSHELLQALPNTTIHTHSGTCHTYTHTHRRAHTLTLGIEKTMKILLYYIFSRLHYRNFLLG